MNIFEKIRHRTIRSLGGIPIPKEFKEDGIGNFEMCCVSEMVPLECESGDMDYGCKAKSDAAKAIACSMLQAGAIVIDYPRTQTLFSNHSHARGTAYVLRKKRNNY